MSTHPTHPPLTAQLALTAYRASLAYFDHLLSVGSAGDYGPEWRDNLAAVVTRLTENPMGWEREEAATAEAQAVDVYATRPTLDAIDALFENYGRCAAAYTHAAALLRARAARYQDSGQRTPTWDSHYAGVSKRAEKYEEDAAATRAREAKRSDPKEFVAAFLGEKS